MWIYTIVRKLHKKRYSLCGEYLCVKYYKTPWEMHFITMWISVPNLRPHLEPSLLLVQ